MDKQMSFWDHLDALRKVLFNIIILTALIAGGMFAAMPWILDNIIMAPCSPSFVTYSFFDRIAGELGFDGLSTGDSFKVNIVSIQLTSQFFIHMSAAFWGSLVIAFPFIIYMIWKFVSPGLYENERKGATRAFFFGNIMFYLGATVGYFLIFPLSVRFLASYQLSTSIEPIVSLDSYMDTFFMMLLAMGAVFELPLFAYLLGKAGLMHRAFFSTYRRHAIVGLLLLAAIITPTSDPFTLFLTFTPIYALWELSSRLVPADKPDDETASAPQTVS